MQKNLIKFDQRHQNITEIILTTETQLKKGYKIGKMHYVRFTDFNAKLRTINLL